MQHKRFGESAEKMISWYLANDILRETVDNAAPGERLMTTLPGVAIHSKIYESAASLVYQGIREQDNCAVIAKVLKQDYPSPQELTRYRQEYELLAPSTVKFRDTYP